MSGSTGGSQPLKGSLLKAAMKGDESATQTMFRQFIAEDERIQFARYLGSQGFWGFGERSFACLTNRRICSLRVGFLGRVLYSDGFLEFSNSGIVLQPPLYPLFILCALWVMVAGGFCISVAAGFVSVLGFLSAAAVGLLLFVLTLMLLPLVARTYYRFVKCGLVWIVREGVPIYLFCNRSRMTSANELYRLASDARESRSEFS